MNDPASLQDFAMSLPGATQIVQWESDLLIKVGEKMFAIFSLASSAHLISLKCSPERAAELLELEGVRPMPYLSKHHWISIAREARLSKKDLEALISMSYEIVLSKLPKKKQAEIRGMK